MTRRRSALVERLQRIRDDWAIVREGLAENRRLAREPISILYVRCDGCGDVTAHMSTQRVGTISRTEAVMAPPEVVCDICRHAQPRTRGDEVTSDQQLVCGFPVPAVARQAQPSAPMRAHLHGAPRCCTAAVPMVSGLPA